MTDAGRRHLVAILAPHGRDAAVVRDLLAETGIEAESMASLGDLADAVENGLGCVLVAEEVLHGEDASGLLAAIEAQLVWSALPFVVLTNGATRGRSESARARIDALENAVLLSRPLHADALVQAVRSALGARSRQYEALTRMEELQLRETEIRESEAKFHTIADSVDQMIFSCLPDGTHDYFNARWYAFTGLSIGEMRVLGQSDLMHADDLPTAMAATNDAMAAGTPFEMEYRLRHRSGEYRWVLGRAQPVRQQGGAVARWYGTCTDIHDDVLARDRDLARSRAERDLLWTATRDLLVILSMEGFCRDASPSWTDVLGYDVADLTGRAFDELAHPDDIHLVHIAFAGIVSGTPVVDFPIRIRHRDGSYRNIEWSVGIQGDFVFGSGRNVTQRMIREAALAKIEDALRQSQKLETIGQLTGGVAHDFNNLLMAIRSSLDLLERRLPAQDDRARQFLDNALQATERGASLTQRMLAFARKQELHAEATDITALMPGLRALLERSVGPQVPIDMHIAPDVPYAMVDTNQLELAVLNLAVNARDAMDGTGNLTVAVDRVDPIATGQDGLKAGGYVRISVTDTGTGMDGETLAQAMEPFFTTKGVGKGTGLGLSMVHGLAVQSGGTFRMESTVGKGTTARLYLPIATSAPSALEADADLGKLASGSGPAQAQSDSAPSISLTILAVDDDPLVLMGTAGLLEDMGHHVFEAYSAKDAYALVEKTAAIDLIVTDQAMPKMTGVELAVAVKAIRPDIPIILASGYAEMPEGAEHVISARLEKPFGPAELARAIGAVCGR